MTTYEFIAALAWPTVALAGVLLLGPGGYLKSAVGEIASKLLSINSSIREFKAITENFGSSQKQLSDSITQLGEARAQMLSLKSSIESINLSTSELAISAGKREVDEASGVTDGQALASQDESLSPDEMYDRIGSSWTQLTAKIRERIGTENFDARSVGTAAWKLADGRRSNPIRHQDAELVETLHSQFKRFSRLYSSRQDWLTYDVFNSFVRGVEKSLRALS